MSTPNNPDSQRPFPFNTGQNGGQPKMVDEQASPKQDDSPAESDLALTRYERQLAIRQISYYLCSEIREPQAYTELFYSLRTASSTDQVYLHLNCPGGDFDTGLQIINNMQASEARVITVLEARAYSMAAFLFLAGDELVVHDNCQLMFHIYSGSLVGKGNEQQAQVIALSNWFEKVMTRICTPFLNAAEIAKVLKGTDIWMDSDEIRRRLARLNQVRNKPTHSTKQAAVDASKHEPSNSEE